jgi:hypothetical protein
VLESLLIAYGGAWFAWFVSMTAGSLVSSLLGTALLFNWMYTPWVNARRKNSLVWPRGHRLAYALFSGRVRSLERIRRRAGKTVGGISKEFLQVILSMLSPTPLTPVHTPISPSSRTAAGGGGRERAQSGDSYSMEKGLQATASGHEVRDARGKHQQDVQ